MIPHGLPVLIVAAGAAAMPVTGQDGAVQRERAMDVTVTGEFDVTLTPVGNGAGVGQMSIAKTFRGALAATSTGQMLAIRTPVEGSAGYVAMEVVAGTLDGHRGSFALQHSGTMSAGSQSLSVTIVPDSGTDALKGIAGSMMIRIEGGKHFYDLTYRLPR